MEVIANLAIACSSFSGIERKQVDRIVSKNIQKAFLAFKNQIDSQNNKQCGFKCSDGNKGKKRRNYEDLDEANPKS